MKTDTKHTPGPWIADERGVSVRAAEGSMNVCDIRGWGYLTGGGHAALGLSPEDAIEIQKANARLISAAPELLSCLKEMLTAGLHQVCKIQSLAEAEQEREDAETRARAAIAKAERSQL